MRNSLGRRRHWCTIQMDCDPGWPYLIKGDDYTDDSLVREARNFSIYKVSFFLQLNINWFMDLRYY